MGLGSCINFDYRFSLIYRPNPDKTLAISPSPKPSLKSLLITWSGCGLNSDAFRLVKDKIEEGSKGIENPLRAQTRASSGDTFSSFTPEGY